MLFKRKEREQAPKFLKSIQEPIGALNFDLLLNFRLKSLFREPLGVALKTLLFPSCNISVADDNHATPNLVFFMWWKVIAR